MQMQFNDILTRKTVGSIKTNDQSLIYRRTIAIAQITQSGPTRWRQSSTQGLRTDERLWPGNPNDSHTCTPLRRGEGKDCIHTSALDLLR
jgi:hypothetical protein